MTNPLTDKKRKFYAEDLARYFAVRKLDACEVDPVLKPIIEKHNLTADPDYNNKWVQKNIKLFTPYLDRGLQDDRRFYIALSSEEMGYGLFADLFISAWSIVGEYTGIITPCEASTEYAWKYRSRLRDEEGNELSVRINARDSGAIVRFVNHSETPNCNALHIPYKGMWRVVYVANQNIKEGEELFVDYGVGFWKERDNKKD